MTQRGRRWAMAGLFVLVGWFLVSLLQTREAQAAAKKISGTAQGFVMVSSTTMWPGDAPHHEIILQHERWVENSDDPDCPTAQVTSVSVIDHTAGQGTRRGYDVDTCPNGDQIFVAGEGTIKTVKQPDGSLESTYEGKWWYTGGTGKFKGITGGGTGKGKWILGKPESFQVEWAGEYELKP
jgi:hypothetical protein